MKITIENQTVTNQDASRSGSVPHTTDFFEARHRVMLEYRQIDNVQEATASRVNDNSKQEHSLGSANLVEEALYWLVSAPALVYLIYLVFGSNR